MIRLKTLTIQNFRSFREAKIEFSESGLVLIKGNIVETGESSGSGKSTILLAISYALDILPTEFNLADFQSWNSKEKPQVTLTVDAEGTEVTFARGKETFVQRGEEKSTGAAAYSAAIKSTLGFNPDILKALTYRAQRKDGLFLSLEPLEMVEFLTQVLGLGPIELAVEKAKESVSQLEKLVSEQEMEVNITQKLLEVEKTKEIKLVTPPKKETYSQSRDNFEARTKEYNNIKNSPSWLPLQTEIERLKEEDKPKLEEFNKRKTSLTVGINNIDFAVKESSKALLDLYMLNGKIKKLQDGQCHFCLQSYVGPEASQKLVDMGEEKAKLIKKSEGVETLQIYKQRAQKELMQLSFSENPKIREKTKELKELQEKWQLELASAGMNLADAKANLDNLDYNNKVSEALIKNKAIQEKTILDLTAKVSAIQNKITELNQRLNAEKDFVSMMGKDGFLGVIFDDVLAEISDEANKYLSQMANVGSVRIGFQTETTTQKGVKRKIVPIVNISGNSARLKSGLSGGMLSSVEQVVDMAVMDVIGRRAGKIPGWLCLDEIFHGQGDKTLESAMELLKIFAQDRLVLVIDHNTRFQESFDNIINVTNENGISAIV